MSAEQAYLGTVARLQELASRCPHVDQQWVLQVASMDPDDMRARLIRSHDWHGHYHHSLDGIPEIQAMPGGGIDGCRTHKEVRAIVMGLLSALEAAQRDAGRYRWLVERFGQTKLPVFLEFGIPSGYIEDGKASIDSVIDAAIEAAKEW
ncbi:MAG: hypothetical protein WAQ08_15965 [Aquabacterium sp.]|uniref:hypothetical protein n=1 Tax=Aquabacterium sp. TaxID=1872578 RepID=UPI003BAE7160